MVEVGVLLLVMDEVADELFTLGDGWVKGAVVGPDSFRCLPLTMSDAVGLPISSESV